MYEFDGSIRIGFEFAHSAVHANGTEHDILSYSYMGNAFTLEDSFSLMGSSIDMDVLSDKQFYKELREEFAKIGAGDMSAEDIAAMWNMKTHFIDHLKESSEIFRLQNSVIDKSFNYGDWMNDGSPRTEYSKARFTAQKDLFKGKGSKYRKPGSLPEVSDEENEESKPDQTTEQPKPDQTTEEPKPDQTTEEPKPDQTTEEPKPDQTTEEPEPDQTTEEPEPDQTTEEPEPDQTTEEPEPVQNTEPPVEEEEMSRAIPAEEEISEEIPPEEEEVIEDIPAEEEEEPVEDIPVEEPVEEEEDDNSGNSLDNTEFSFLAGSWQRIGSDEDGFTQPMITFESTSDGIVAHYVTADGDYDARVIEIVRTDYGYFLKMDNGNAKYGLRWEETMPNELGYVDSWDEQDMATYNVNESFAKP